MSQASAQSAADFGNDHITTAESPLWAVIVLVALLGVALIIWKGK